MVGKHFHCAVKEEQDEGQESRINLKTPPSSGGGGGYLKMCKMFDVHIHVPLVNDSYLIAKNRKDRKGYVGA